MTNRPVAFSATFAALACCLLLVSTGPIACDSDDSTTNDATAGTDSADTAAGNDQGTPDSVGTDTSTGSDMAITGSCNNADGQLFPPEAPWNTIIRDADLADDSADIISYLDTEYGDGGSLFQIDYSIEVLLADGSAPREFTPTDNHFSPDCDTAPVPVPASGAVEGYSNYDCDGGDCHLIVVDSGNCTLYEMWVADIEGNNFESGCLAIWDIAQAPPVDMRGDYCTSADAAGLPIAPLMFTSDEVAAGTIRHALRFILPNQHIRDDEYVRPGTHSTGATSGPSDAPPYTARLRLRSEISDEVLRERGVSENALVIARALRAYGMFLADGGNITLVGASDQFSDVSWESLDMGPHELRYPNLSWTDFEVVDSGPTIRWSEGECTRTPITE